MKNPTIIWLFAIGICLISACQAGSEPQSPQKESEPEQGLYVLATTSMIADAVKQIGSDRIHVESLMGPGVDPHLYQPTQSDLEKLNKADLIIHNGLKLEGKMEGIFDKLAKQKPVLNISRHIQRNRLRPSDDYENAFDPHIWFDVMLWHDCIASIPERLAELDTSNAAIFQANFAAYAKELMALHKHVKMRIDSLPGHTKVLITTHDAFGYFSNAYNIPVKGLQGVSTASEISIRDVTEMINFIIENDIRSVFVETSSSDKSIEAVANGCAEKGHELEMGRRLYADALGDAGSPEGTYVGMVRANVKTIVNGLK